MMEERQKQLEALYDLTSEGWENPKNNPHIWPQLLSGPYYSGHRVALSPRCTATSPTLDYEYREGDVTSVVHWGQRKLLLTEIEFLTRYGHLADTVVYAGAAPGTHTAILMILFPNHRFYLYDPAPFNLDPHENLIIRQEMFLDAVAMEWTPDPSKGKKPVLFICDIRSADFELVGSAESDKRIRADMEDQKRWTEIMKPAMASLKLRLPWERGTSTYLSGDIYFQVWAPPKSTETRLFTDGLSTTLYDNQQYESQCFYHNTVVRLATHAHDVEGVLGIDHCGDCLAETQILARYIQAHGLPGQRTSTLAHGIGALMTIITETMRGGRTLADVVDAAELKRRVTKQQWIDGKPAYLHVDAEGFSGGGDRSAAELLADSIMRDPFIVERLGLIHT
jgi:cap2 methyltransferase